MIIRRSINQSGFKGSNFYILCKRNVGNSKFNAFGFELLCMMTKADEKGDVLVTFGHKKRDFATFCTKMERFL
jgi:hypothetical protein